jgi:hypothetical protein
MVALHIFPDFDVLMTVVVLYGRRIYLVADKLNLKHIKTSYSRLKFNKSLDLKIQHLCWRMVNIMTADPKFGRYICYKLNQFSCIIFKSCYSSRGRRGRDRMVVGFTTIYAISAYHHWCWELESRSGRGVYHYVIKFVSDLQPVGGFLRVLRFPPRIKLTTTI